MKTKLTKTFLILTALMALNACGVKPGQVDSPAPGKDEYPHTYPDPATDPKPNSPVQF